MLHPSHHQPLVLVTLGSCYIMTITHGTATITNPCHCHQTISGATSATLVPIAITVINPSSAAPSPSLDCEPVHRYHSPQAATVTTA